VRRSGLSPYDKDRRGGNGGEVSRVGGALPLLGLGTG
jgi:hypothetical protein